MLTLPVNVPACTRTEREDEDVRMCLADVNPPQKNNLKTWWGGFCEEATERTSIYQYATKHVGLIRINNLAGQEEKKNNKPSGHFI